jgi:hypothetical protein
MKDILQLNKNFALIIILSMSFLFARVPTSEAQDVVVLFPGVIEQRNFFLPDVFSLHGFIVITIGNATTLSISLSTNEGSGNPLFKMYYMLSGLAFSVDEGPQFILEYASTPFPINTSIPINSSFGMALMGATITGLREKGDFGFPAVFTLTLTLEDDNHDDGGGTTTTTTTITDDDHDDGDHDH